jgi:hypothetical protein
MWLHNDQYLITRRNMKTHACDTFIVGFRGERIECNSLRDAVGLKRAVQIYLYAVRYDALGVREIGGFAGSL